MTKSGRKKQTMVVTQPAKRILNPFDDAIDLSTSDGHKIYKDKGRNRWKRSSMEPPRRRRFSKQK